MDMSSWGSADTHDSIKSIESCRTRLDFTFSRLFTDNDIRDARYQRGKEEGRKERKITTEEEFA